MNLSGPRAKWGAGLLVVLLLASTFPVAMVTGASSPDLSKIRAGEIQPGDCLTLETAEPILARQLAKLRAHANDTREEAEEDGDPSQPLLDRLREDEQVPTVCLQGNGTAFRELVETGNELIRAINQTLDALEESRDEAERSNQIPYLLENFTAPRHGGVGEWEPRSSDTKTGFRDPIDPRVTEGFALTDQPGATYENGLNTTLVFPAIDLGGTALDPRIVELPQRVHRIVEDHLPDALGTPDQQTGAGASVGEDGVCFTTGVSTGFTEAEECFGEGSFEGLDETYDVLREAYVATGDELVQRWLATLDSATLEVRHRFNLAEDLDGIRLEVLTDRPPRHGPVPAGTPLEPAEGSSSQGYEPVGSMGGAQGLTGESDGWVVDRFDLSPWVGQRVWIVARAVTSPAFGIPGFFEDPSLFQDDSFYGYALDGAFVNGSALPHNLGVLEIDADQIQVDGQATVAPPLADRGVDVAVTNQGLKESPAQVSLRQCDRRSCGTWQTVGTVTLAPGEVAVLPHSFPDPLSGTGALRLEAQVEDPRDSAPPDQRPEDNRRVQELLVEEISRVKVGQAPGTTLGLQASPYQGGPEEARNLRLRLTNTGNVPVDGRALLEVTDLTSGRAAPGTIQTSPQQELTIDVGQTQQLTWTVLPSEPGIYRATVDLDLSADTIDGPDPSVHLFADRSPGVVCAEDPAQVRRCGHSWVRETDLPDGTDRIDGLARGPSGHLAVLASNGSIQTFDGASWSTAADLPQADELVATSAGVLALGSGNQATIVSRSGAEPAATIPLSRVDAVASDGHGNAIVAGPLGDAFGVAVGDGHTWDLIKASPFDVPQGPRLEIQSVTPLDGYRVAVGILLEEAGAWTAAVFTSSDLRSPGAHLERTATIPIEVPGDKVGPPFQIIDWETTERTPDPQRRTMLNVRGEESVSFDLDIDEPGLDRVTFDVTVERSGQTTTKDEVTVSIDPPASLGVRGCSFEIDEGASVNEETIVQKGSCQVTHDDITQKPGRPATVETEAGAEEIPDDTGTGTWTATVTIDPGDSTRAPSYEVEVNPSYIVWTPRFLREAGQTPLLGVVPWANTTGLLVEGAASEHPTCDTKVCAFQVFADRSMDRPARPVALPEDLRVEAVQVEAAQAVAGQGWVVVSDDSDGSGSSPSSLYQAVVDRGIPGLRSAALPVDGDVETLGGGGGSALATVGTTVLEMRLPPRFLDNDGDWGTGETLEPKAGDQAWTTILGRGDVDGLRTGPGSQVYLRGTCTSQGLRGAADLPSCLDGLGQGGSPTVPSYPVEDLGLGQIQHLNLTLRYNLRDLGDQAPKMRLLLEPGPTTFTRDRLLDLLEDTPLGPPGYHLEPVDPEGGQGTPLLEEPITIQDAQVITVDTLRSPTPDGWITREIDLRDLLEEREELGRLEELVGVELAIPPGTGMAIDALWLNVTQAPTGPFHQKSFDHRTQTLLANDASSQGTPGRGQGEWSTSDSDSLDRQPTAYHSDLLADRQDGYGAWRLSEATHRPTWTFMGTETQGFQLSSGTSTRIDRLVTPVIDLRQAEHPVLNFDHAYAFPPDGGDARASGWVEAQVEVAPGIWSQWTRLFPDDGYGAPEDKEGRLEAYWGSNVNRTLFEDFETLLDPSQWRSETFDLVDQPTVLTGKRVRLAFNALVGSEPGPDHEGWVISDLRVASSTTPTLDLELVDARFEEGYDVLETGLPPGGTVDLNVTLRNVGDLESQGGASLTWEMVGIGEEERVIATGGTPLSTLQPGAKTWIELPVRVPSDLDQEIFPEEPGAFLRVKIEPGAAVDEDPLNNLARVGSLNDPIPIKETRDLQVRVQISPETASPDRPRLVDVRLSNPGNTPLNGITVERTIQQERGTQGLIDLPDTQRHYVTERALPAGEERSLSQLVPGLDAEDRLWTPQRTGSFVVSASASLEDLSDHNRRLLLSVEPFLRSSVETSTSGTTFQGSFDPVSPWSAGEPGAFGSAKAWRLEPSDTDVPANGTTFALETPTVDLSPAREASISFIHRYDLEERFDGARLEASLDGGQRWFPLAPTGGDDAVAYDTVLGGNPLADGNLSTPAFTGTSGEEGSGGWTLSTFDLKQIPGSTEPGEMARMDMETLTGRSDTELLAPSSVDGPDRIHTHPSWIQGSVAASELFLVENLTGELEPRGPPGFLYTGTGDRAKAAGHSSGISFNLPLPELEGDQRAVVDWWEWAPVTAGKDTRSELTDLRWHRGISSPVYTTDGACMGTDAQGDQPEIRVTEVAGYWRHYEADVTDAGPWVNLTFQWLPWSQEGDTKKFANWIEGQPGLVLDGLQVRTFDEHPSGEINPEILWEERWGERHQVAFVVDEEDGIRCELDPSNSIGDPGIELIHETEEIEDRPTPWEVVELPGTGRETNRVFSSSPPAEPRPEVFDATPLADSRLVLPALDLSTAGEDVELSFDHLPRFFWDSPGGSSGFASGGVLEASVFDPVQGEWGSWEQVYSKPGELDRDAKGGYTEAVHVYNQPDPRTPADLGKFRSLPFEAHRTGLQPDGSLTHQVYLYNGDKVPGWTNASYDLSRFTGERVRFAFHAFHSPHCSYEEAYPEDADDLSTPGVEPRGRDDRSPPKAASCPNSGERWLVDNITVEGKVFSGQPVQLRFVAGMDGSIHNATWAVDEIEVLGSSYEKNVGLYTDEQADRVAPEVPATWNGVVRNLGTDVRRDLAVRATVEGVPGEVALTVDGETTTSGTTATSQRFNLPMSTSVPFSVDVTVPQGTEAGQGTLRLELVRWNEGAATFARPSGEQVRTNLQRALPINLTSQGLNLTGLAPEPVRVQPGEASTIRVVLANPQAQAETTHLVCRVQRIVAWEATPHGTDGPSLSESPILAGERIPCRALDSTTVTLAAGQEEVRFEARPSEPGAYQVTLEVFRQGNDRNPAIEETAILWAGDGPRALFEDFETEAWRTDGEDNGWSPGGDWRVTDEDAGRSNRSILSGISGSAYDQGQTYRTGQTGRTERLVTPPIDLHNVTEGRVHFSMLHMARLAYGDGADVKVRVLENEAAPEADSSWTSEWCTLEPVDGYDGKVYSYHVKDNEQADASGLLSGGGGGSPALEPGGVDAGETGTKPSPDYNPALPRSAFDEDDRTGLYSKDGLFGTHVDPRTGKEVARWDEGWQVATFPLHDADGDPKRCEDHPLVGRTIQVAFTLYKGEADDAQPTSEDTQQGWIEPDPLDRGRGQGWFIDSVVVAAADATVAPREVEAPILDAALKRFPVGVANQGSITEHTRIVVDRTLSTVTGDQATASGPLTVPADGSAAGHLEVTLPRDPLAIPFKHTVVGQAQGLLDPNQPASTTYDLRFDPRVWPDLSAEILEPSDPPVEGVPSIVPIQITNHGRATSPPTQLVLQDLTLNETVGEPLQIPSIPPPSKDPVGASTVIFAPWTPPSQGPDHHRLQATLDPEDRIEEYTKDDNQAHRDLDVQPLLLPDLTFDEANITLDSPAGDVRLEQRGTLRTYIAGSGVPVTVKVPVANHGSAAALNVDIRLFLGTISLPAERIDRLEPGQATTVSFTFLAEEGTRELSLEASTGSRDLVPGDNQAPQAGVIRLLGTSFQVDASFPATVELDEPGTRQVNLTLENQGSRGVLLDLKAQEREGVAYQPETTRVFVDPGETVEVPGTVEVRPSADGGDHHLTLTASDHEEPELTAGATLAVHLAERHELTVALQDQVLAPGSQTVTATFDNQGNLPEDLTVTTVLADGQPSPPTEVTVPRGSQRTVDLAVTVPPSLGTGEHTLRLLLNGTLDDERSFQVEVPFQAHPILDPLPDDLAFTPDGLVLPVRVTNLGNAPFNGTFHVDQASEQAGAQVHPATAELLPGQSLRANVTVPDPEAIDDLSLEVQDKDGTTVADRALALPDGRPDLMVLQHRITPSSPAPGEPTELRVTVANNGQAAARDMSVDMFVDDEFALRVPLDALDAGASRTVEFTWPAFEGRHAMKVVLDPGQRIPDLSLDNNALVVLTEAGADGSSIARLIEEAREVPTPAPLIVLWAVLLAHAVIAWRRSRD